MQTLIYSICVAVAAVLCSRKSGAKKSETDRLYALLERVESYGGGR